MLMLRCAFSQQPRRLWELPFSFVSGSFLFSFNNPNLKEMSYRNIAEQIFLAGVKSVLPDKLIRDQVKVEGSTLFISSSRFSLDKINRILVVGAGKASAKMAKEIESILGDR